MLGMMAVVILVLLIKVLPVFQQVFNQMGMEMNGVSRGLLNAGNVISRYSSVFLILAAVLIGCILFFSLTEKGHSQLRKMAIHLPFFREIPVAMDYSRLTQGLSLGLRSGLSPETSLELTKDLISQPVTLERLRKASSILDSGETFSRLLQNPVCSAAWKAVSSRYPSIPVPVTKPSAGFPGSTPKDP